MSKINKDSVYNNVQSTKVKKVPTFKNLNVVPKVTGNICYNSTDNHFYGYNGSNFVSLSGNSYEILYQSKNINPVVDVTYFAGAGEFALSAGIEGSNKTLINKVNAPYIYDQLPPGLNDIVFSIYADTLDRVYVGGKFITTVDNSDPTLNYITIWNGAEWNGVGPGPGLNNRVLSICKDSSGNIYVGGQFTATYSASDTLNCITKWDGSQWLTLGPGPGLNERVRALYSDPSGIYVGGSFNATFDSSYSVSNTLNYITKWDGSQWLTLGSGSGLDDVVYAVTGDSFGNIYAGGTFSATFDSSYSVSNTLNKVAKWNGTEWLPLGPGLNGRVNALTVDSNGILYAGGEFTGTFNSSSDKLYYIAQWNGIEWLPVGSGLDGSVNALISNGTDIYIGGSFTYSYDNNYISDIELQRIALWKNNAWKSLGIGAEDNVNALALSIDKTKLYVGGIFNTGIFSITITPNTDINTNITYNGKQCNHISFYNSGENAILNWNGTSWIVLSNNGGIIS